jgi:hypothetical protein
MGPEKDGTAENTALIEVNVRCPESLTSLEETLGLTKGGKETSRLANEVLQFAEDLSQKRKA